MLVWKTQTLNVNVASLRYRCLLPLRYLAQRGVHSVIYGGTDSVKLTAQTQAIVFVKSFRLEDVKTCEQAYQLGVPIILDLCDNIFIAQYASGSDYNPAQNFCTMARRAAVVVTTGTAMQAEVERVLAPLNLPTVVTVIPDGSETLGDIDFAFKSIRWKRLVRLLYWPVKVLWRIYVRGKRKLKGVVFGIKGQIGRALRERGWLAEPTGLSADQAIACQPAEDLALRPKKIAQGVAVQPTPLRPVSWPEATASVKTVLWFGNHGAKYGNFGMLNILDVAPVLESIAQQQPLRLMVVSNSRQRYEASIASLPFETDYLPWHPRKIYEYIRASDVVIIPNSQSVYSICKSANRAVLALSQGTPVVASRTPALAMFSEGIWLDDWEAGLRTYLLDPDVVQRHVAKAQQVIYQELRGEAIAQKWLSLLHSINPSAFPLAPTDSSRGSAPSRALNISLGNSDLASAMSVKASGNPSVKSEEWS